ncbi:uncharacterized protein VTP21DRAFT_10898 [Calcarisporiella thermophila]|uniref:uncharacterized protein n=1 Tax=Calcarisporiella thermophila TaxID=911321 RepID=UPI0037437B30
MTEKTIVDDANHLCQILLGSPSANLGNEIRSFTKEFDRDYAGRNLDSLERIITELPDKYARVEEKLRRIERVQSSTQRAYDAFSELSSTIKKLKQNSAQGPDVTKKRQQFIQDIIRKRAEFEQDFERRMRELEAASSY